MKLKALLLIAFVAAMCMTIETFAQGKPSTLKLNSSFQPTQPQETPTYIVELTDIGNDQFDAIIYTYTNKHKIADGRYAIYNDRYLENGSFTFYYQDGAKESAGEYQKGVRTGNWKRYNYDGSEKTPRFYNDEGAAMLRKALGYDKL